MDLTALRTKIEDMVLAKGFGDLPVTVFTPEGYREIQRLVYCTSCKHFHLLLEK